MFGNEKAQTVQAGGARTGCTSSQNFSRSSAQALASGMLNRTLDAARVMTLCTWSKHAGSCAPTDLADLGCQSWLACFAAWLETTVPGGCICRCNTHHAWKPIILHAECELTGRHACSDKFCGGAVTKVLQDAAGQQQRLSSNVC